MTRRSGVRHRFDLVGFTEAFSAVVRHRGVTQVEVAQMTGVSNVTISRMKVYAEKGQMPDTPSLLALAHWAGINPMKFFATEEPIPPYHPV